MELRDYLKTIKNRKWLIIQAVVVVTAAAVIFSLLQSPVYLATAKILFQERSSTAILGLERFSSEFRNFQTETSLQTQIELIKLPSVAEKAAKYLDQKISPRSLTGRAQIKRVGETNLVQVSVQDSNPRLARDIANAFAQGYVEWGKEYRQRQLRIARQHLRDKLQETREDILALGKKVAEQGGNTGNKELQIKLDLATNLYTVLYQRYEELKIEETMEGGGIELASLASTPKAPIKPTPTKNGLFGGTFGLIFGLALAFLVDYLDNTIKTSEDAEQYYGLPVLGLIPLSHLFNGKKKSKIVSYFEPKSTVAESFRVLRTNIQYLNFDQSIGSIIITSAGPREGKTSVLVNLAATLAAAGNKVIVLGADLRRPQLDEFFKVDNSKGLTAVLTGSISFKDALQDSGVRNLWVLPSGPSPPNPSELLGSTKMQEILAEAKKLADFVLIDTPPAIAVTDAAVLAPKVDGIMAVARAGQATRETAKQFKTALDKVGVRLLGVVLNNVPVGKKYGYYYYQYAEKREKGKMKESRLESSLPRRRKVFTYISAYLSLLVVLFLVDRFLSLGILSSLIRYFKLLGKYIS